VTIARCEVVEEPPLKPPAKVGARNSRLTSTELAPCGTSMWKAYMSTGSRRHWRVFPPALNFSPERLMIGPVGPCSPGIHSG
jgi:hypothetical protein